MFARQDRKPRIRWATDLGAVDYLLLMGKYSVNVPERRMDTGWPWAIGSQGMPCPEAGWVRVLAWRSDGFRCALPIELLRIKVRRADEAKPLSAVCDYF